MGLALKVQIREFYPAARLLHPSHQAVCLRSTAGHPAALLQARSVRLMAKAGLQAEPLFVSPPAAFALDYWLVAARRYRCAYRA